MRLRVRANALKEENRKEVIVKTGLANEADIRGEKSHGDSIYADLPS
jgi:hypothetical protein